MKIIPLESKFEGEGEVKGFSFSRLLEGKKTYLYEVEDKDNHPWYEVIRRYSTPIVIDFAKKIMSKDTERERYPKAKDFGFKGWNYPSLKEAVIKFNEIENEKPRDDESNED